MIIELNLISFLPLIVSDRVNKKNAILYFVIQSVGSLIILSGGIVEVMIYCVAGGLLLKGGLAPFHFWGPILIVNLSKINALIFLT